jgi:hypothetical protein
MDDGESPASVPGGKKPRRRKEVGCALPPSPPPPDISTLKEKARQLVAAGSEKALYEKLREDLMTNYLIEVEAGQDMTLNPQHSRGSRKQAKDIAELLIQLTSRGS